MPRWRNSFAAAACVAVAGLSVAGWGIRPAAGQDNPESILPPGFGDPKAPPPPAPTPRLPEPPPSADTPPPALRPTPRPRPTPATDVVESDAIGEGDGGVVVPPPPPIEMPDTARRSPVVVGTIDEADGGFPADAFGDAHGKFLSTLMRRTNAPLPSRWAHIALRRVLLSRIAAPAHVNPVDWVAERAWLLLRMGEADGARLLVQGVDVADFTPKMYDVAVQAALATADPGGLCPLEEGGRRVGNARIWPAVGAMCAALSGEGGRAGSQIVAARRARGGPRGIDLLLAEKVVGAGSGTRRAVTIQWDGVDRLTAWRFGLANATAVPIPDALFATTGTQARAWQARAPLMTLAERLPFARTAATLGVFSNASLVGHYSMMGDDLDVAEIRDSDPGRLQVAYTASGADRIAAMRTLWKVGGDAEAYANQVLTAAAATRLNPSPRFASDVDTLVASLFAGGFARQAGRWAALTEDGDNDRAWAMLAVGGPARAVDAGAGRIDAFIDRDGSAGKMRAKLLVAALAGLGRIDAGARTRLAETLALPLGGQNDWTRAIDRAARGGQGGTVMLLAAAGMQAPDWRRVPPAHLFRITRALRATGQDYAARMIAAEALGRT